MVDTRVSALVLALLTVSSPVAAAASVGSSVSNVPEVGAPVPPDHRAGHQTDPGDRTASDDRPGTARDNDTRRGHVRHGEPGGTDSSGWWPVHRDVSEPSLFEAATSADGDPAVDEPTTVTVELTAIEDARNVTVSLPDYRFIEGDGREFTLGAVTAGETYTVEATVTPTEEIARYLEFTATGRTADGPRRQQVNHDLALVERDHDTGAIALSNAPVPEEIPDTTTDPWGERRDGTAPERAATRSNATVTNPGHVEGCFFYTNQNGNPVPGRQLRVEVYDADPTWDDHIATGHTEDDGCFNIEVNDPSSADPTNPVANVYVWVYADNPAARVLTGGDRYRARFPGGSRELRNGETVDLLSFETNSADRAYRAANWSLEARRFIQDRTGWTRRQVRIEYPESNWPHYNPSTGLNSEVRENHAHIALPDPDDRGWGRTTVHHEYAHAVHYAMYEYDTDNLPDMSPGGNYPESHNVYSETNPGFALVEGWAEFVEGVIAHDRRGCCWFYNITEDHQHIENNEWFNTSQSPTTDSAGDTVPGSDTGDLDGRVTEGSYASIWLDIVDPVGDDRINDSFENVFDTMRHDNVGNMRHFLNAWNHGHEEALAVTAFRYGVGRPDPYEPNERVPFTVSPDTTLRATVLQAWDDYRLTLSPWTETTVSLDRLSAVDPADVNLTVYEIDQFGDDPNGPPVAISHANMTEESVTIESPRDSEAFYVVQVSSNHPAAYRLSFDSEPGNDDYEDNDERPDAAPIDDGTRTLRIVEGENDYYEVDLQEDERLSATIEFDSSVSDLDLYAYELTGSGYEQVDASFGVDDDENVSHRADEDGTYLVRVQGTYEETARYSMTLETEAPPDHGLEPNDDFDTATQPVPPAGTEMQITRDESDFFAFDLAAGEVLNVSADHGLRSDPDHTSRDLDMYAYDPDRNLLDRDLEESEVGSVTVSADEAGTYYVEVAGRATNNYTLSVEPEVTAATTGQNNNDLASALRIQSGRYPDLEISGDDRRDHFRIDVQEGEVLSVDAVFDHDRQYQNNIDLTIYEPNPSDDCIENGQCAGEVATRSWSDTDNESTDYLVQQTGTYYIEVENSEYDVARTPYDLVVERIDDDTYEENDAFSNASELFLPRTTGLRYHGDDDTYRVQLDRGETMNVSILFDDSEGDLDLSVYGPGQSSLATADSADDNESLQVTAQQNGTHYIEVTSFYDTTANGYTLVVEGANLTGDLYVPDQPIVPITEVVTGVLSTGALVETDPLLATDFTDLQLPPTGINQYAVQLGENERLNASAFLEEGGSVNLTIYDDEGNRVGTTGELSGNGSLSFTADDPGTYYVRAENPGETSVPVSLDVATSVVRSDRLEFNDDRGNATAVSDRSYPGLRIGEDDTDYYAVDLEPGQELAAAIDFDHDAGDLDLAVHGPDGSELASSASVTDDESAAVTADESGTYYVEVYGFAGATGDYSMTVDLAVPDNDRFEANEGIETAADLSLDGGSVAHEDLRIARGDRDVFAVSLDADERLRANLTFDDQEGDLDFYAYGPGEDLLRTSTSTSDDESLALPADESGTHYLAVEGFEGATADYGIEVTVDPPLENDRFEANDDLENATPLSPGTYEDLRIVDGEGDVFAVDLVTNETLTATARFDHGTGDLDLEVAGPDEEPLRASASITDDETVEVTADRAGTYYVRVYGFAGASAPYDLELDAAGGVANATGTTNATGGNATGGTNESGEQPPGEPALDLRTIAFGERLDGELDPDDPRSADNRGFHEPVTFRGEAGQVVSATMQSDDDAYLILRGPDGEVIASDDDGAAGLNAQLTGVELPTTGEYTLVATSYWEDRTFEYTLSLDRRSSPTGSTEVTAVADTALPGETTTVEFTLTNTGTETQPLLLYTGVDDLPAGWTVSDRSDEGGVWQAGDAVWLFQEVEPGESVRPSLALSVPESAEAGAERTLSVRAFDGTDNDTASVTVAVQESTLAELLDGNDDGRIGDAEILTAIDLWQSGDPVPGTDRTISDTDILRLMTIWEENEEV